MSTTAPDTVIDIPPAAPGAPGRDGASAPAREPLATRPSDPKPARLAGFGESGHELDKAGRAHGNATVDPASPAATKRKRGWNEMGSTAGPVPDAVPSLPHGGGTS